MSIVFELSKDPQLLEQYYQLREACFRKEVGVLDFDGSEDERDRESRIFLAHSNGKCLGGARISSDCAPVSCYLAELGIEDGEACMWERAALAPHARAPEFAQQFGMELIRASCELGYRKALVLSTRRNARFYRIVHSCIGVPFEVNRAVPECAKGGFAGIEHYLSVSYMTERVSLRNAA